MDSIITLADARVQLARFSIGTAEFLRKLNRTCEYYLDSDVYTDIFSEVSFDSSPGYITIPRCYGRAIGVQDNDLNKPIVNQQIEWFECGISRQDPSRMTLDGLIDQGSHFCTQSDVRDSEDIEQVGTLRVKVNDVADRTKTWRFDGKDSDGNRVFSSGSLGVGLTLAAASGDTTQTFREVQGIQAPTTVAFWTLWKVISGVETQIGRYEPGETRPRYVRYKTRVTDRPVRVFCHRGYVPLVAETDWVYPSNINAIEYGFMALGYRDRGDYKAEKESWQLGKDVLKEQYARLKIGARTYISSDDFGGLPHGGRRLG